MPPCLHEPALTEDADADTERQGEEALVRADVARRPLPPDVLLASRQGEHEAALSRRVHRGPAQPPRQLLKEGTLIAAREEPHAVPSEAGRTRDQLALSGGYF